MGTTRGGAGMTGLILLARLFIALGINLNWLDPVHSFKLREPLVAKWRD